MFCDHIMSCGVAMVRSKAIKINQTRTSLESVQVPYAIAVILNCLCGSDCRGQRKENPEARR